MLRYEVCEAFKDVAWWTYYTKVVNYKRTQLGKEMAFPQGALS